MISVFDFACKGANKNCNRKDKVVILYLIVENTTVNNIFVFAYRSSCLSSTRIAANAPLVTRALAAVRVWKKSVAFAKKVQDGSPL